MMGKTYCCSYLKIFEQILNYNKKKKYVLKHKMKFL